MYTTRGFQDSDCNTVTHNNFLLVEPDAIFLHHPHHLPITFLSPPITPHITPVLYQNPAWLRPGPLLTAEERTRFAYFRGMMSGEHPMVRNMMLNGFNMMSGEHPMVRVQPL